MRAKMVKTLTRRKREAAKRVQRRGASADIRGQLVKLGKLTLTHDHLDAPNDQRSTMRSIEGLRSDIRSNIRLFSNNYENSSDEVVALDGILECADGGTIIGCATTSRAHGSSLKWNLTKTPRSYDIVGWRKNVSRMNIIFQKGFEKMFKTLIMKHTRHRMLDGQ